MTVSEQASIPDGEPQRKRPMLTRGQVAKRLGTSPSAVERMQADGVLPPKAQDPDGTWYFDAEDVERVEADLGVARSPLSQASRGNADVEQGKLAVQMMAQLMGHADKATKNALATNEHLLRANEKYQARVGYLEDELAKCFELLKTLGDAEHERKLAVLKEGAEQERRDKALGFAMDKIALLWPIVQTKLFGVPIKRGEHPAWDALEAFLKSLSGQQMETLFRILSQDQVAAYQNLMQLLTTPEPEAKKDGAA